MVFKTTGNKSNSVILFFHAMGVTGESSMPVAEKMAEKYYCIMPTSTVYCSGQRYQSKRDEIQQIVRFLGNHGIKEIELIVASSIGADLAMAFLTEIKIPVKHVFFDSGQFAQIGKATRRIMVPFLYIEEVRGLYEFKSDDADSGEFTYFCIAPDTNDTTYHIELRYGSDLEALGKYDEGDYAYWLGSGISTDYDQTMVENCIELFCKENLSE